jgi:DNA polymerase-3 subunit gamma/tau
MSYQVLARKWRPNNFSQLVGQEHVVTAISNALDNNRLHHAYLFTGTRGVGKTTIARIFSKSLNCEVGMSSKPCGVCATCKEIERGNFVDLLEIDAASRTKVEDTRELLDNVQYKPTHGDYKVYLIDEVHMLSKHSFNALLKTLEEPPPHVKFLLATTDPQKLPVTILSRCLQFNLKALSRAQIGTQLTFILEQEKIPADEAAIAQLSRAAQGSMRDALSLTDQAIAQGNGHVTNAIVTDMLGLMDKGQILKLVHGVLTQQSNAVMEQVEQLSFQGPDYAQILAEIMSLLHQVALTQFVPDACKLETISARAIYQLAKTVPAEQVQLLYQIALQGKKDIQFAADGRSGLEMTLLRMLAFIPAPLNLDIDDFNAEEQNSASSSLPVHKSNLQEVKPLSSPSDTDAPTQKQQTITTVEAEPELESVSESESESERISDTYLAQRSLAEPATFQTERAIEPQLFEQQEQIVEQAESLHPSQAAAHEFNMPMFDELPTGDADMQPQDQAGYDFSDPPMSEDFHSTAPDPISDSTHTSENTVPATSSVKTTESLLALRRKLQESAKQQEEQLSSVKKSEPESESSISRLLSQKASNATQAEQQPSSDSAMAANQALELSSKDDTPPWQESSVEPKSSLETSAQVSQQTVTGEIAEQAVSAPAPIVTENKIEEFDPNAHLDETIEVEVDFEVPAFLESGEKVLAATQLDTWSQLINQMSVTALTKQLALHSSYSKQDDTIVLTLLESKAHLNSETAHQQLQDALSAALQQSIKLMINLAQPINTPYAVQQTINQVRQQHAQQVVNTDQSIVQLRDTFNASIVEQSIKPR